MQTGLREHRAHPAQKLADLSPALSGLQCRVHVDGQVRAPVLGLIIPAEWGKHTPSLPLSHFLSPGELAVWTASCVPTTRQQQSPPVCLPPRTRGCSGQPPVHTHPLFEVSLLGLQPPSGYFSQVCHPGCSGFVALKSRDERGKLEFLFQGSRGEPWARRGAFGSDNDQRGRAG